MILIPEKEWLYFFSLESVCWDHTWSPLVNDQSAIGKHVCSPAAEWLVRLLLFRSSLLIMPCKVLHVSCFFYLLVLSIANCICGFVHFSLQFCQLLLKYFEDLYVAYPSKIIMSSFCINRTLYNVHVSLFLVIFLALTSITFAVKIATPALFSLVFPLYIFSRLLL